MNQHHHRRVAYNKPLIISNYYWCQNKICRKTAWGDYRNCLIRSSIEHFLSVENSSVKSNIKIFDIKISQAVLLLASSSSAENVVLDRTRQIDIGPSEDGIRSGKSYVVTLWEIPYVPKDRYIYNQKFLKGFTCRNWNFFRSST